MSETPKFSTRRRCPYCGRTIELGDCPIVATSYAGYEFRDVAEDVDLSEIELPSGARPLKLLAKTRWPVIATAPRERVVKPVASQGRRSKIAEAFGAPYAAPVEDPVLVPLHEEDVAREDVPARACPECEFPLPQRIDERVAVVVGVVGVNRVGKTHLLATSLAEAYRNQALASLGCTEFVPDDNTSKRFIEEYYYPLFRRGEILEATNPADDQIRFSPLVFDVTLRGASFSLVLHDVAGEILGDHRQRAHAASYLAAARGIIFVVDPRDIDSLRERIPDWIVGNNELSWDQGALLAACIRSGGILNGRAPVPLAVTIGKADLLPQAVDEPLPFLVPRPSAETQEEFVDRVRASSRQVAEFLERHGAHSILAPAREYHERARALGPGAAEVTYHAVSALGSAPDEDERLLSKVRPLNCVDPLAAVLMQIVS